MAWIRWQAEGGDVGDHRHRNWRGAWPTWEWCACSTPTSLATARWRNRTTMPRRRWCGTAALKVLSAGRRRRGGARGEAGRPRRRGGGDHRAGAVHGGYHDSRGGGGAWINDMGVVRVCSTRSHMGRNERWGATILRRAGCGTGISVLRPAAWFGRWFDRLHHERKSVGGGFQTRP